MNTAGTCGIWPTWEWTSPRAGRVQQNFATVAELIEVTTRVFRDQDDDAVHELTPKMESGEQRYHERMAELIRSEEPGTLAAPRAMLFRYLKWISAHRSNLLNSRATPFDRLDFYEKSKATGSR